MYGNGLDMRGHVDSTFKSKIEGGIWLIRKEALAGCGRTRKPTGKS